MAEKFEIDFFELSFLAAACMPERPIARSMFFESLSERYYHEMSKDQRARLFEWLQKDYGWSLQKPDCLHFYCRFNPQNQYLVYTEYEGKKETHETYRYEDQYHTTKSTSIQEDYIYKVEPIR